MKSIIAALFMLVSISASNAFAHEEDASQNALPICTLGGENYTVTNAEGTKQCTVTRVFRDQNIVRRYSTCDNPKYDFAFALEQVLKIEKAGGCVYIE